MKSKLFMLEIAQLSILTAVHFLIDSFAGMLPVLMPALLKTFNLELIQGMIVLTTLNITCNIMQIFTGHLRSTKTNPLFMQAGLILASIICLVAIIPNSHAFFFLNIMFLICGVGIAITHPEGLRAIHTLKSIPASITTAVFMTGGFLGFSSGGWLASHFVERFGFKGLIPLMLAAGLGIALIYISKIKLAIDSDEAQAEQENSSEITKAKTTEPSIWSVFGMSVPISIGATVLVGILPTKLNELGFTLSFGGKAVLLFGAGSAAGSLVWAAVANKFGNLKTAIWILFAGAPFLAAYLIMMKTQAAIILLFFGGFLCAAAYPLIVTIARNAKGLNIGQRMGFVVGGSWGIASLILLGLAKLAETTGITFILALVPISYAAAAIIGLKIHKKNQLQTVQTND